MTPTFVIPAKAGIHIVRIMRSKWIPAFAGMTSKKIWDYKSKIIYDIK